MLGPTDLIAAARLLAETEGLTEAHIRRAISTAYYAVFHHVPGAGATRFLRDGKHDGAAFSVLACIAIGERVAGWMRAQSD